MPFHHQRRSSLDTFQIPALFQPFVPPRPTSSTRTSRRSNSLILPSFCYPIPNFRLCRARLHIRAERGLAELEESLFGGAGGGGTRGDRGSATSLSKSTSTLEGNEAETCLLTPSDEGGASQQSTSYFPIYQLRHQAHPHDFGTSLPVYKSHGECKVGTTSMPSHPPSLVGRWRIYGHLRALVGIDSVSRSSSPSLARRPSVAPTNLPTLVEESPSMLSLAMSQQTGRGLRHARSSEGQYKKASGDSEHRRPDFTPAVKGTGTSESPPPSTPIKTPLRPRPATRAKSLSPTKAIRNPSSPFSPPRATATRPVLDPLLVLSQPSAWHPSPIHHGQRIDEDDTDGAGLGVRLRTGGTGRQRQRERPHTLFERRLSDSRPLTAYSTAAESAIVSDDGGEPAGLYTPSRRGEEKTPRLKKMRTQTRLPPVLGGVVIHTITSTVVHAVADPTDEERDVGFGSGLKGEEGGRINRRASVAASGCQCSCDGFHSQ